MTISYDDAKEIILDTLELRDNKTVALIVEAINYACYLACSLFRPGASLQVTTVDPSPSTYYVTAPGTRVLRYEHLYNTYTGRIMLPMSFAQMKMLYIPYESGGSTYGPDYYHHYGTRLYYMPRPRTTGETIDVHYVQHPARIGSGNDLPYGKHEHFIIVAATQFMWATQEEVENAEMWGRLLQILGTSEDKLEQIRQIMGREVLDANRLSNTIQQSISTPR